MYGFGTRPDECAQLMDIPPLPLAHNTLKLTVGIALPSADKRRSLILNVEDACLSVLICPDQTSHTCTNPSTIPS